MNFKRDLIGKIMPFWLGNAIDRENGGIYTCVDKKGEIYGTDKSVWFQGRALWSLCKAYNSVDKKPEYLEAAKIIYEFLPKCTDIDGRMFFTVTANGRELQKRRYYFSETFAAIGCAEYYKATGDNSVWKTAEKYFDIAYECYIGKRETAPKINPENRRMQALSPVMIMLATCQVMRSASNGEKYGKIASECLDKILHGGFLTEKALVESVSDKGEFVDSPVGRIINPGHSMEAAWFVMLEGIITGNKEAIAAGKKIIDITWPVGWDDKNGGGIIAFADIYGKPPQQLEWDMKLWWPQCETMIALRMAYMLFGDEGYNEKYETVKKYCEKYFCDEEDGEWFGYLHYDNTVSTSLKGNIFKGPFHVPRLYIIMAILDEHNSFDKYIN